MSYPFPLLSSLYYNQLKPSEGIFITPSRFRGQQVGEPLHEPCAHLCIQSLVALHCFDQGIGPRSGGTRYFELRRPVRARRLPSLRAVPGRASSCIQSFVVVYSLSESVRDGMAYWNCLAILFILIIIWVTCFISGVFPERAGGITRYK